MTASSFGTQWEFWIDRGGTFTDVVARRPDGSIATLKLLSENPEHYQDAAVAGIAALLDAGAVDPSGGEAIAEIRMGTTVATNALLERKGDRTLLVTNRGFADALRIAYQHRPKLFARRIELPSMLYESVVEVDGRVGAHGEMLRELDIAAAEADLRTAFGRGIRACAIVLMHGYRYPAHEQALAELAKSIGFTQISVSHAVSPLMKLVARGDTTVADAYLSPVLRRYVDSVRAQLPDLRLRFMQSSGGLIDAASFRGKDAILSGPAGGVIGAVQAAKLAGFEKIIGFDMGGTSTDVMHYAGEYERALDVEIAGVRLRTPILQVHTVAAGGGSLCQFDGLRLSVGPQSAGANPGPAAYRRGGPLTVTDCNVLLGRIQPEYFPKVFGDGTQPLDAQVVRQRFDALAREVSVAGGSEQSAASLAAGFIRIAIDNMANAIKKISTARGYDLSGYVLNCFGGAAGQHACLVAAALGMKTIFLHPCAGVLSAYGIGLADVSIIKQLAVEQPLNAATLQVLNPAISRLGAQALAELMAQSVGDAAIRIENGIALKYRGTDTALVLPWQGDVSLAGLRNRFEEEYRKRFGFLLPGRDLDVESLTAEALGVSGHSAEPVRTFTRRNGPPTAMTRLPVHFDGKSRPTPFFDREALRPGDTIAGPAILCEANTTTVIEPGWSATLTQLDHLIIRHVTATSSQAVATTTADPILLEVFNNLFMSIAEQMGVTLATTASSVNIKERLDFSCALFDAAGQLIANAPHMPVHLGSMGESVQAILERRAGSMRRGDVYALNAPYAGGTHLPDVTVVMPVFDGQVNTPLFYVAARGHHADIGGTTPGSMPCDSTHVEQEGVLLDNVQVVANGEFLEAELRTLLTGGRYPVRNVEQNLADLRAQVAACQKGAHELARAIDHYSLAVVQSYMNHVQDNAEEAVRRVIHALHDGEFSYALDNGAKVQVAIRIDRDRRQARIDFTGTSQQQPNNFNAPKAVTRAAVLYVFRTLVDSDIPMNAGCARPLEIVIPPGSMLNPDYPAAVVAGNVETSQVITDCLYAALGVLAASQGTMNNFTFGDGEHQYYETICGGSGAGPDFDGCDAVQTHMTNSRLTDPEVLEWRYPVLLDSFGIRRGSGGHGRFRGGDGVERRIRFLKPMTAVVLANHRKVAPFGLEGGAAAATGNNWIERAASDTLPAKRETFGGTHAATMNAGDVFVIQTPGGGGFGVDE